MGSPVSVLFSLAVLGLHNVSNALAAAAAAHALGLPLADIKHGLENCESDLWTQRGA